MTPLDRVSLRASALSTLGLPSTATKAEVRAAFKVLAFKKHPDQNPECGDEFSRITEAYRTLCENADELGFQDAPPEKPKEQPTTTTARRVSRPTVSAIKTSFDEPTLAECWSLLSELNKEGRTHVATDLYRKGRNLTYYVPNQLGQGKNHVAVPTGMLNDTRRVMPRILSFSDREALGGYFDMPEDVCAAHFPGARHVQIRFASS